MSRHIQFMFSGALTFLFATVAFVSAQPALPPVAVPAVQVFAALDRGQWQAFPSPNPYSAPGFEGSQEFQDKQVAVNQLQMRIQSGDLSKAEEDKTAAELKKGIASLFDLESKQMEQQIAQIQAQIKKRDTDREKLIHARFEKIMDAPKVGELSFHVHVVEKQKDGSSIARVALMRTEKRNMATNVTKMREEKRVRQVDGKEQEYTVQVPETITVNRDYVMQVPAGQEEVSVPKGQDVNTTVKEFVDALDDF